MWYDYMSMGSCRLFPLLVLVIIALMIYAIFGRSNNKKYSGNGESSLDIVKKRYAKGEIDKSTFETMKRELQ